MALPPCGGTVAGSSCGPPAGSVRAGSAVIAYVGGDSLCPRWVNGLRRKDGGEQARGENELDRVPDPSTRAVSLVSRPPWGRPIARGVGGVRMDRDGSCVAVPQTLNSTPIVEEPIFQMHSKTAVPAGDARSSAARPVGNALQPFRLPRRPCTRARRPARRRVPSNRRNR